MAVLEKQAQQSVRLGAQAREWVEQVGVDGMILG